MQQLLKILTLGGALLSVHIPSNSQALDGGRPIMKSGDSWTYRQFDKSTPALVSNWRLEVTSVMAESFVATQTNIESNASAQVTYTTELNYITDGASTDTPSSIRFAFPLEVGKKIPVEYNYKGSHSGRVEGSCKVSEIESIQVAAGKFDAFKVECKMYQNNHSPDSWSQTYNETLWYSPKAKFWVKLEREKRSRNYRENLVRELTEYQAGP